MFVPEFWGCAEARTRNGPFYKGKSLTFLFTDRPFIGKCLLSYGNEIIYPHI